MTDATPNVVAQEVELPIERVHPDPFQPRVHPDAELADSIKTQGVLQAITVEPAQPLDAICEHCDMTFVDIAALGDWMINDGERRWLGSTAAGKETILAKIIPPSTEGQRLKRQLTSNTGKPLTPIEEAFAFKRIMEVEGWSQVELAKQLGRPRSVIGDRIRLVELDEVWITQIQNGTLQVSHAALLSPYSAVPAEFQRKAWEHMKEEIEAEGIDETIPIEDFRYMVRAAFLPFLKSLSEVKGYKGPIVEIDYGYGDKHKERMAADPQIWEPIFNAAQKKQRDRLAAAQKTSGNKNGDELSPDIARIKQLPIPVAPSNAGYSGGHTRVYMHTGWNPGIDPEVFLASVDPKSLSKETARYGGYIYTTDNKAIAAAKKAFKEAVRASMTSAFTEAAAQFDKVKDRFAVSGGALRFLLPAAELWKSPVPILCEVLGIDVKAGRPISETTIDEDLKKIPYPGVSNADVERLATACAAHEAGALKLPDTEKEEQKLAAKLMKKPFDLPSLSVDAKAAEKAAKKEKGQQRGKEIAIARKNGKTAPPTKGDTVAHLLHTGASAAEIEEAMA